MKWPRYAAPISLIGFLFLILAPAASAGRAERLTYVGVEFVVYWVDLKTDELSLYWRDPSGQPLGTFDRLRKHLGSRAPDLKFAINAGIFSRSQEPLGLHIQESNVLQRLNLGGLESGQVNFYMKPNGVFYLTKDTPGIVESTEFAQLGLSPRLACQSGPLLVRHGQIHPAFQPGSTNLHWRSGVGVTKAGQVVFAISKSALCFHEFARLFVARLGCENALYLDGDICAIHLPELGYRTSDPATRFAGMFTVLAKPKAAFDGR